MAPSQFLVTVPVRGLAGYREAREQRWRYYSLQGARLPCPLRNPEGLQQWLEAQQFVKSLWQWHKADVNIEGDLVPAKVLQVFRTLVEDAVEACHLSGERPKRSTREISFCSIKPLPGVTPSPGP